MTKTITARQYFQTVLDAHISDEMDALSAKYIAGLDARNAKRKSADSKEKREVRARVDAVKAFLIDHTGEYFTRNEIAVACGISDGQASFACQSLGDIVTKGEIKVNKTRKVVYAILA